MSTNVSVVELFRTLPLSHKLLRDRATKITLLLITNVNIFRGKLAIFGKVAAIL